MTLCRYICQAIAPTIEVLIKLLERRMTVFMHTRMSSKSASQKMADTSKDELLLGGGIRHIELRRSIMHTENKFLLA